MMDTNRLSNNLLYKENPILKLNTICPYYTMYPIDFPLSILSQGKPGEWVLDPFCGRGTTNYAARLLNMPSVGIDSNPIAHAVTAVKFVKTTPQKIVKLTKDILSTEEDLVDTDWPQGNFWKWAYHKKTLREILTIRKFLLKHHTTDTEIALRALMLGILHGPLQKTTHSYLSNQMPRTYATKPNSAVNFWQKKGLKPMYINTLEVVEKKAYISFQELPDKVRGKAILGDTRNTNLDKLDDLKIKWVVTSPPYLGMNTYESDQWLRNWFIGGPDYVVYSRPDQLGTNSKEKFIEELAKVWKKISFICVPGAKMAIRFGALPSKDKDPSETIIRSLTESSSGWQVESVTNAGASTRGNRQSAQFKVNTGNAVDELDLIAFLKK